MSNKKLPLIGLIVFVLISLIAVAPGISFIKSWDIQLLHYINYHRPRSLDGFTLFFSSTYSQLGMLIFLGLAIYGTYRKNKVLVTKGLLILASVVTSGYLKDTVKPLFNRPRPFVTYDFIENISTASKYSFPSGHTCAAFGLAISFWILFPQQKTIRTIILLWAILMGLSRLLIGVHYPSDVIGGFGLSTFVGSTIAIYGRDILLKEKELS